MENKYQYKIITIPNLLSFARLLMIPVILWLYLVRQETMWTTVMLALSGITDIVDGVIARRFNMISDFGKGLDPVADKLTQIAMLFCLVSRFPWMLLPLILLAVKELSAGIVSLLVIRKTGKVYGAVWHGKAATVALYSMMLIHLLWHKIPPVVSGILIGICTALVLQSAILYGIQNIGILVGKQTAANKDKQ